MDYLKFLTWFFIGIVLDIVVAHFSNDRKIRFHVKGLRIHHSVYGVLLILAGFLTYPEIFIGSGLGIIFSHTVRLKKLLFVERMSVKRRGRKNK